MEIIIYFWVYCVYNKRCKGRKAGMGLFNIGIFELILVLVVAFLIVGPKDLPRVARWIGRQLKSIRKFIRELKKETGWDEFSAEFRETKEDLQATLRQADISKELKEASEELKKGVSDVKNEVETVAQELKEESEGGNKA